MENTEKEWGEIGKKRNRGEGRERKRGGGTWGEPAMCDQGIDKSKCTRTRISSVLGKVVNE